MVAAETHFQVAELVRVVYEIYEIAGMIHDEMRMLICFDWPFWMFGSRACRDIYTDGNVQSITALQL